MILSHIFLNVLILVCIISFPASISAKGGYKEVAVGDDHIMVLKEDGSLWGWGNNDSGQLGNGTYTSISKPAKILDNVKQVAAAGNCTVALLNDGTLWGWGYAPCIVSKNIPVKLLDKVRQVAVGAHHIMAIKEDGSLWGWGSIDNGGIGDGTSKQSFKPKKIMKNVRQVACGYNFTMAVLDDGSLWGWGNNLSSQMGGVAKYGEPQLKPVKILDNVKEVSCGFTSIMAIKNDGSLWGWGQNGYGQPIVPGQTVSSIPTKILDNVKKASSGELHVMVVLKDDTLLGWGENRNSELGDGTTQYRKDGLVKIADGVRTVACGNGFSIILTNDGSLMVTGKMRVK